MKKVVSLFLALVLVCSISVSALAAVPKVKASSGLGDITIGDLGDLFGGIFQPEPGPFDNFLEDFLGTINPNGGSLGTTVGNFVKSIFGSLKK